MNAPDRPALKHALFLVSLACSVIPARSAIVFDASPSDRMILRSDSYELILRKSNGSFLSIRDLKYRFRLSAGSRFECLWGAVFPGNTPDYVGGCSFAAGAPNSFSYQWSAAAATLTLRYNTNPQNAQKLAALVLIRPATNWFDLQITISNNFQAILDRVLFPSDLVFLENDISAVTVPELPGLTLLPTFWTENRSFQLKYPGAFAHFIHLETRQGNLALYTLAESNRIAPGTLGLIHDDAYLPDSSYYQHSFSLQLPHDLNWTSPWVRVRLGGSLAATVAAVRADSQFQAYPSLREKLGSEYTPLSQAPLLKADLTQLTLSFRQLGSILDRLPTPAWLHLVAYQPRGFDENYPDFLPPAAQFGATTDMASLVRQAQGRGLRVVPYINPTWWDEESPTLTAPGADLDQIALLDRAGQLVYETYGNHGGYVVSPSSPFVQNRLDALIRQLTSEVPNDALFEDQIGARPWLFDHNPSSPSPTSYSMGWLDHTRRYAHHLLMTENGFDRLAQYEMAFHGSLLLAARLGHLDSQYGAGNWKSFPLSTLLLRDKVLFYQHDLAPETATFNKATLTWNVAMGFQLTHDLSPSTFGGGLSNPWLFVVGETQRRLLSLYADESVHSYVELAPGVTATAFDTTRVLANWNPASEFFTNGVAIAPEGFLIERPGLRAGFVRAWNERPVAAGDHLLIETTSENRITVAQLLGADTPLTLMLPDHWGTNLTLTKVFTNGIRADQPFTRANQQLEFLVQSSSSGNALAHYDISRLPIRPQLSPESWNSGRFQFWLHGETGFLYEVEHSTNLADWVLLERAAGDVAPILVTDDSAPSTAVRFYRASVESDL